MDRGSAHGIVEQAAEGNADGGHCPGRRMPGHRFAGACLLLGLALLGACTTGHPPPGPLALGGPLLEPLAAPARPTPLAADLRSVKPPLPRGVGTAPAPLPALRPALVVRLPPPAKPRPPESEPHVAWLPKLKPTIGRPTGASTDDRPWQPADGTPPVRNPKVLWPPPPKPPLALGPADIAPAAGPSEEPPVPRPEARPITVDHGGASRPQADAAIAVGDRDQRLQRLDEAAREALLAGDPAGALRLYERLSSEAPAAPAARLGQAIALQQLGRSAEARAVYQSLLQADPDDLGAKIALLGMVAERAPEEALTLLRRLARDHPDDHRLPAQIAIVLAAQGDLAGAIVAARRAVALAPANLGYRTNLAVLLDRAGQSGAAVEQYQNALELATSAVPRPPSSTRSPPACTICVSRRHRRPRARPADRARGLSRLA